MNEESLDRAIQTAAKYHEAGRLNEAAAIYNDILARDPNHPEALHLLGLVAIVTGQPDRGIELIRRAIEIKPGAAIYHSNLGYALRAGGQLDEAIAAWREAIRIDPGLAMAHNNLGNALCDEKKFDEAIVACREALRINPGSGEAYNNLGIALFGKGKSREAIEAYQQSLRIRPDLAQIHINLGNALMSIGEKVEAIASYRQAIGLQPDAGQVRNLLGGALTDTGQAEDAIRVLREAVSLRPGDAEAHNLLGNALGELGKLGEAMERYRDAIRLMPGLADAHNNLGSSLQALGRIDEAIFYYREAVRLKPDYAVAHNNLGAILPLTGRLDEAIAEYREAIRIQPDDASAHGNLIYALYLHPDYDAKMIRDEERLWNQRHGEPVKKFIHPHANTREPERRLRVGYVSPDFRDHVVGRNLLPLLRENDRGQVEIFCYSNEVRADEVTAKIRQAANVWRSIVGLSDPQAVDLIRRDQIDILVDLSLHTARNRLMIFAYKPAPVQATYLGYCASTGLEAMDYRLSDPYLDGPDSDLSIYSERTIRLPETYWCYIPAGPAPEPSSPPVAAAGHITFGCLNNFAKVSSPALDVWAEILRRTPESRLIIHSHPGRHLDLVRDRFAGNGISPDRIEFYLVRGDWQKYLETYGRIDIALDPFPCGGGITTCDAIWMGVPVISLVGRTSVGRGGKSILSNIGMTELIAGTPEEYRRIAVGLAGDLPRLAELRRTLRTRMRESPLMDAPRFARNVEAAYRQMWREWCANPSKIL